MFKKVVKTVEFEKKRKRRWNAKKRKNSQENPLKLSRK